MADALCARISTLTAARGLRSAMLRACVRRSPVSDCPRSLERREEKPIARNVTVRAAFLTRRGGAGNASPSQRRFAARMTPAGQDVASVSVGRDGQGAYVARVGALRRAEEIYAGDRYVVYRLRQRPRIARSWSKRSRAGAATRPPPRAFATSTSCSPDSMCPGVVRPLGLQDVDGVPALVLEPAGAHDLGARLRQGRARCARSSSTSAVQMATVVGHVHGRNVVHRDLSPAKFVLDEGGGVTLVGFEFATALSGQVHAGELEGTLAYMAPEQTGRMRRAVDHRADLYALGATFYEMLVGSPPFPPLEPARVGPRTPRDAAGLAVGDATPRFRSCSRSWCSSCSRRCPRSATSRPQGSSADLRGRAAAMARDRRDRTLPARPRGSGARAAAFPIGCSAASASAPQLVAALQAAARGERAARAA